jgi:hypothetical protein
VCSSDLVDNSIAEMYSHSVSNNMKLKKKKKKNTFQQSSVNVGEASPLQLSSTGASHPGVKEDQGIPEDRKSYGREITLNDLVVDITCCLAKIRVGNRYSRLIAYFSLKTEHDIRYMIFLRSNLTTAHDEILRSIDKSNNKPLRTIAEDYINTYGDDLMIGRIKYKPTNKYVTQQHRKNHKHGLFALWATLEGFTGQLYLNGEYYDFYFTDDLSPLQVSAQYTHTANWQLDEGEIE